MLTAQRLYARALRVYRDRVAVVDGERRLTYSALDERSARLGNVIRAAGADFEHPAAAFLGNCAEFVEFDVACSRAGVTRVGISDRLSGDECRYILEHSQARVLLASPELLERVGELPEDVRAVVVVGGAAGPAPSLAYEDALAAASARLDVPDVTAGAPNYILYTSGTTGRPKGAAHSHAGRVASTVNMLASELRVDDRFAFVHAAPVTHGSGSKLIAVLAAGGTNLILPKFDVEAFAELVEREGATHSFLVPTMLQRLTEAGPAVTRAVASMRQITFGGSPIASLLFSRAIDSFGPILTQVYGSCEAPHPVTLLRPTEYATARDEHVLTSAGRAAFGVDLKIVAEDGTELAEGEDGELLIRGHNLMSGYWRNPEATAEAFTDDGWYRSGDVATIDENGLVTFRDRKHDLIISGGLNVYPSEVERVLAGHPGVREVAVVGYPDEEWGESVLAYVVPTDGWQPRADELIDWSRERLASYKKPRRVEFLERLPLGASNKVLKKQLRDTLWQGYERQIN